MTAKPGANLLKKLTPKQKLFCREYIFDWNATRSYKAVYKGVKNDAVAGVNGNRLLKNAKIQAYITEIQEDLEKTAGISRLMVLQEHKKIAFSSIAHLHNTWIRRKDFESLTEDQKSCIAEIDTKTKNEYIPKEDGKGKVLVRVEYVKIKLYDKQKALDSITKMVGYDAPTKTELTGKGGKDLIPPARVLTKQEARELLNKLEDEY